MHRSSLILAAAFLSACSDPTGPNLPPSGVLFHSTRDGNFEIYMMNTDGTGITRLTTDPGMDQRPDWSPDLSRIAFASNRDGDFEIYVMNADGSGLVKLTDNAAVDHRPQWSPDGSRIAFASTRDGNFEIYVMQADGTAPARLTTSPSADDEPEWSPDGRRLAFSSNRNGLAIGNAQDSDVFTMASDGSDVRALTSSVGISGDLAIDDAPVWSPSGAQIAFRSRRDGFCNIYIMRADGSAETALTDVPPCNAFPAWSRDGAQIFYTSQRSGNAEIWVMNADGSGHLQLTSHPGIDATPAVR